MTKLAALALLMLAGCGYSGPGEMTSADVDNIAAEDEAADAAYDAIADSGLEDRIAGIEQRLDDQDRSIADIQQLDEDQANVANDNDAMLDERIREIEARLRM